MMAGKARAVIVPTAVSGTNLGAQAVDLGS